MKRFLIALLLAAAAIPAAAQEAAAPTGPKQVLVIGDEMAGGMGAGLTRMVEGGNASIQVFNRFNEGSGLSRPELYDWAAAIPKMVEGKNFSAAVILVGLNDHRDIRDNNNTLKFGTPDWDAKYKARIDAVIDALTAQHIQVFWMSEPVMGDPAFDADMQNVTALIKDRTAAKGATFVDIRTPFLSPQGGYVDHGPDETGADRKLRQNDGVTFMKVGNNRLGQIALAALNGGAPAAAPPAPGTAALPAPPDAAANSTPAPAPSAPAAPALSADQIYGPPAPKLEDTGPIFVQEGIEAPHTADDSKKLVAAVAQDKETQAANSASIIGIGAVKGSYSETLLTTGLAAPAPKGRFDDFTATPPK